MECPRCKEAKIAVIDSRDCDNASIRRRRMCDDCKYRFTTYERIEPTKLMVTKRDGTVEPFSRDKILRGLAVATEKRNIASVTLEAIADHIETALLETDETPILSKRIGEQVMRELKAVDEIAYLRFASVYRNFASLEAFEQELQSIKQSA